MAASGKKTKRFSFFRSLLLLANVAVIGLLMAGFFAAFVPPDKNWMMAFAGLAFPYVFFVNLMFIPLWLLIRRRYALLPLIFVIICWARIGGYYQFGFSKDAPAQAEDMKILSYNVRLFDLYNWKGNKITKETSGMFTLMHETAPDFLFIQEYHAGKRDKIDVADSIQKYTGLKYSHISLARHNNKVRPYGIATFSRWPIVAEGSIRFSENPANMCIFSDIAREKDTIRVFNIHLESIYFSREDYLFVTDIMASAEEQKTFSKGMISISKKLKTAFIRRTAQIREVTLEIEKSPYPVIVCGDFNDTPSSYTYQQISALLEDSFVESGRGMSKTYTGPWPSFRIDYIMYDKDYFTTTNYERLKVYYSDHFPITSTLIAKIKK